jgi:hypothetical protein
MATLVDYIVLNDLGFDLKPGNRTVDLPIEQVADAVTGTSRRFRPILAFTVDPEGANPMELTIKVHPTTQDQGTARTCRFTEGQYAGVHVLLRQERLWDSNVADRKIRFELSNGQGTLKIDDVVLWFQRDFPSIPN